VVDVEIKAGLFDEVEGRRVVLTFIGREIIGWSHRVVALTGTWTGKHAPERLRKAAKELRV
jgi:hypothetical protein